MYLNTQNEEKMKQSICKAFNMSMDQLMYYLKSFSISDYNSEYFDNYLENFIEKSLVNRPDEILFFHFSPRLRGLENDLNLYPLSELLLTKNEFSTFLKNKNIEFFDEGKKIKIIYDGKAVNLDEKRGCNKADALLSRLEYGEDIKDDCINGFAFKDLIYSNFYAKHLQRAPEFLVRLADFLDYKDLITSYEKNSDYYCYEYKVPLEDIIFLGSCEKSLNLREKQNILVKNILLRLLDYHTLKIEDLSDSGNLMLGTKDGVRIDAQYYVSKERVPIKDKRN